jgi:hypothetical protein
MFQFYTLFLYVLHEWQLDSSTLSGVDVKHRRSVRRRADADGFLS